MIKINTSKGLGDAIYLRAAVLHLLKQGEEVEVFTRWPDVFADLPVSIKPLNAMAGIENTLRHVSNGTRAAIPDGLNEWTFRCKKAGIEGPVEMRIDWPVRNQPLLDSIREQAAGRRIFVYQPLKVVKNPYMELLRPRDEAFRAFVEQHSDWFRIKLGHPPSVADDRRLPCELNMYGKGFIFDTFDICTIADMLFGEVCFTHTIAEALEKPVTVMFARAAQRSKEWVRHYTPESLFHKTHLARAVYDDI